MDINLQRNQILNIACYHEYDDKTDMWLIYNFNLYVEITTNAIQKWYI